MSIKDGRDYLLLVWKEPKTRRCYTIGELSKNGQFEFSYGYEVREAIDAGFKLLIAFPDIEKVYKNDILYLDEDIYVSVKNKNKDKIDVNYSLFDEGKYSSGDVVGYVSVSLNENVIRKENIYVKKVEIKKHISWWTKFLRWLGW